MSAALASGISIEGHPTESLQAFLRSYFGVESHHAFEDLCAPFGVLRNAALLASIELGHEHPTEDFNLTLDQTNRTTERDVLRAAAAYYCQFGNVKEARITGVGTLLCSLEGGQFLGVTATGGGPEMFVTVRKY